MLRPIHSAWLRLLHGIHALVTILLVSSGWAIYNASPLYNFTFPVEVSLGHFLTEALRWHFLLAWIFALSTTSFILLRMAFNLGGPSMRPKLSRVIPEIKLAFRFKLFHEFICYNNIQRIFYWLVILSSFTLLLSGLILWKPVQLHTLELIFFNYEVARYVHFWSMISLSSVVAIHLLMVIVHPKTILSMFMGAKANTASRDTDN